MAIHPDGYPLEKDRRTHRGGLLYLALDRMMSRRGQHALVGQTYLLLEGLPDLKCFREGAERLCRDHPILDAYVHRNPFSLVPSWRIEKGRKSNLGLNIWRESGCKHYLEIEAGEVESAHKFGENLLNGTTEARLGLRNLRLDLVLLRAGGSLLVLTWNHLLFDGKGAEFLPGCSLTPPRTKSGRQRPPHGLRGRIPFRFSSGSKGPDPSSTASSSW